MKGAPHTFDSEAFVEAVRAVREASDTVLVPGFDRDLDKPEPDAISVAHDAPLVLVEGNYLLLDDEPWSQLRLLLDLTLFVDIDDETRVERLIARHVAFGKSRSGAVEFVHASDERNAELVAASKHRADIIVTER